MPRGLRCAAHLSPQLQLAMNAAHAAALDDLADEAPAIGSGAEPPATFMQPRRMKLAYFGAAFGGSNVAGHYLGALTSHTLGKFEVYACQLMSEGRGTAVDRIDATTDTRLVDLSKMSDHAAATEVYKLRPHIGVLLDGYASANRIAVMAMRPAPIQLSYISQGTSTGSSSFIRYALTDAVLSPPSQLGLWTERLTMLPVAHVNDYWRLRREVNLQPIKVAEGRDDYGLPARRFVMSNQGAFSRMDPSSFQSWCNLLGRLPNATLWLNRPNDRSEELMEQQLAACGAARDNRKRIHFSNSVARDEQVRRGGISDLALDTPMHSVTLLRWRAYGQALRLQQCSSMVQWLGVQSVQ